MSTDTTTSVTTTHKPTRQPILYTKLDKNTAAIVKKQVRSPVFRTPTYPFSSKGLQGKRPGMEDTHASSPDGIEHVVVDGHGGPYLAKFLSEQLITSFHNQEFTQENCTRICNDLNEASKTYDCNDIPLDKTTNGAVCVYTRISNNKVDCLLVGDCIAFVGGFDGTVQDLTPKLHNGKDAEEKARVIAAGGNILPNGAIGSYLEGGLMVTRAFGDFHLLSRKNCRGLVCTPTLTSLDLTPNHKFLVLCCDGVTDVMTQQQIYDYIVKLFLEGHTLQTIPEQVCKHAIDLGSTDNVTLILVDLQDGINNFPKEETKEETKTESPKEEVKTDPYDPKLHPWEVETLAEISDDAPIYHDTYFTPSLKHEFKSNNFSKRYIRQDLVSAQFAVLKGKDAAKYIITARAAYKGKKTLTSTILATCHTTFPYTEKPLSATFVGKTFTWKCPEAMYHNLKWSYDEDFFTNKYEVFKDMVGLNAYKFGNLRDVPICPDWYTTGRIEAMDLVVRTKFSDPELRTWLLSTKGFQLVKIDKDEFWSTGRDGNGKNMLCKLIMKFRDEL